MGLSNVALSITTGLATTFDAIPSSSKKLLAAAAGNLTSQVFPAPSYVGKLAKAMLRVPIPGRFDWMVGRAEHIVFMYNPTEYTDSKSSKFTEVTIPGLPLPLTTWVSGGPRNITMRLFLDKTEELAASGFGGRAQALIPDNVRQGIEVASTLAQAGRDVATLLGARPRSSESDRPSLEKDIAKLFSLVQGWSNEDERGLGVFYPVAPICQLVWGPRFDVEVVIKNVSVRRVLFDSFLNPIRAFVDIQMSQYLRTGNR